MKLTGIVRRIDPLGRVVIPKEMRNALGINSGDPIEVMVDGRYIIMRGYKPGCCICGAEHASVNINGQNICADCVHRITIVGSV